MSKPYALSDIYAELKRVVRLWPIEDHKPTTFAVLSSMANLNESNLGMIPRDKDLPHFYSKAWADLMYNPSKVSWGPPAVFLFETEGQINLNDPSYIMYNFELAVLDTPNSESELYVKAPGDDRSTQQIFDDTEIVLLKIMNHLMNTDFLSTWSKAFQAAFRHDNGQFSFSRFEGGSHELKGTLTTVKFRIPCVDLSLTLETSKEEFEIQDHSDSQPMPLRAAVLAGLNNLDELGGLDDGETLTPL